MKLTQWAGVFKKAAVAWSDDFAPSMGAAISYYTMFSLAPLLVLVIAVAGLAFGAEAVQAQIATQLSGMVGEKSAEALQAMVKSAAISGDGILAAAISIGVLIIGATSVFSELQSALDRIWHVPEFQKPSGIWRILRARVFSFGLILGLAFLLMVSLSVSTALAAFGNIGGLMPGQEVVLQALNIVVSIGVTTVLFANIFKFMPSIRVEWRDVWIGAIVTAVLFEIGKALLGLYLGKSGMANSFAGAGSLVLLLAWVYYAAQIFLLGAEFTKVYALEHGSASSEVTAPDLQSEATKLDSALSDDAYVTRSAELHKDLELRVSKAVSSLVPKLAALGVMAVLGVLTDKRMKSIQKRRRRP
ncbi:YihY/virulence factor BrkB family protein [Variovorax sp. J31P207]|uniref:YihY/virulence factor BrkB family protein n=1 Tax=Variovorax sp. J31P207 TaxID=3053510 RepID=UPI002577E812|nr:YihY/virulence factor BrkB family protein [Variovorax sp. J31P207]MDM0071732.1 YihY/virulence factor BrkB family protein [Variovorax sp. J31P207]